MWDSETGYQQWHATRQGAIALKAQQDLLRHMIYPWARRGHSLLEINCGDGFFLEGFFESGLDVTGNEGNQALMALARKRMGQRAELVLGSPDTLPFDDESFSYVACLTWLEYCGTSGIARARIMLREALRLAEHGLILGFYNRFSLSGLCKWNNTAWGWPTQISRLIREECCRQGRARIVWGSTLLAPQRFWREGDHGIHFLPIGSYAIIRVDFSPKIPLTPIPLRTRGLETA